LDHEEHTFSLCKGKRIAWILKAQQLIVDFVLMRIHTSSRNNSSTLKVLVDSDIKDYSPRSQTFADLSKETVATVSVFLLL